MKVATIAMALAKNVFQVLGMYDHEKSVFNKGLNLIELVDLMLLTPLALLFLKRTISSRY